MRKAVLTGASPEAAAAQKQGSPLEGRASFDSLWEKLQQQHLEEASAGANLSSPPAQQLPGRTPAATSEADFWKKLQGQ